MKKRLNAFGKTMIFHHLFGRQFFDGNRIKTVDQLSRCLVHEVVAAAPDTLVNASNDLASTAAFFGAFAELTHST